MKLYPQAWVLSLLCLVQCVDIKFYEGTMDASCAGATATIDAVPAGKCSHNTGTTWDCILVWYYGSDVATSKVYSKQGDDYCSVVLEKDLEDGQYYGQTGAITGYMWTEPERCPTCCIHPACSKATTDTQPIRYAGYTVNGRMYNIGAESTPEIPNGSSDVQEIWLKENGYIIIDDIGENGEADFVTRREESD